MAQPRKSASGQKTCFVIMPISDVAPYEPGHFRRVYNHIIKPACQRAGIEPIRADDVERTNHIIIDVLRKILEADVVLCDLSSRNANVMYELGIRQAFSRPVVLIKDSVTERVFDIQGLRDIEYDVSLRVDLIDSTIAQIASSLHNTSDGDPDEVNSIVQLLGVHPAKVSDRTEISRETSLVLDAVKDLTRRLGTLESQKQPLGFPRPVTYVSSYKVGGLVTHREYGDGEVVELSEDYVRAKFPGHPQVVFHKWDPAFEDDLPF